MHHAEDPAGRMIADALRVLRSQFPEASEDEVFERFVTVARNDRKLQTALLRDETLVAKLVAATRRLAGK